MELVLSHSKILTYEKCPRMYQYQYVLNLEPEYTPDYLTLGTIVHEAIASAEKEKKDPLEVYQKLTSGADLREGKIKEGRAMITNWLSWKKKRSKDEKIMYIEEPFTVFTSDGIPFAGKIDRVSYEKGVFKILDYKTGNTKVPQDKVLNDPQLNAYALCLMLWYGFDIKLKAGFLYLRDMTARGGTLTAKTVRETEGRIYRAYDQILRDTSFPKKPGWQCKFCQYQKKCEEDI